VDINDQNDNDGFTLNNITTVVHTTALRIMKNWLLIYWIFNASELGNKYYKAGKYCHELVINEIEKYKRIRETADIRDINKTNGTSYTVCGHRHRGSCWAISHHYRRRNRNYIYCLWLCAGLAWGHITYTEKSNARTARYLR